MKRSLRVGLLMDSYSLTAWSYAMIEKIIASQYAGISLLIINDNRPPGAASSFIEAVREKFTYFLYDLYVRYDARKFRPPRNAFETKDASVLLRNVPALRVTTTQRGHSHYFADADIRKIREFDLDVIIRLGFGILRGEILRSSRYGVWSYHHGDNRINRGGPAGFWELRENLPVTGSVLQILSEELDNGLVIYRSFSSTHNVSLHLSRNNYYWKTLDFVPRKLKELYEDGEKAFFERARALNPAPYFYSRRLYSPRHATNNVMLGLMARQAFQYFKGMVTDKLLDEQWFLLYSLQPGLATTLSRFRKILPPPDRFWADPHVIRRNGKYYVFLEEYLYATKKGHIAVMTIDEQGNHDAPVPVLERPYHLSYPFVFEHEGACYMIPESRENRTIELYRCVEFPCRWEYVKNIMSDIEAVDTTLFRHRGVWWMFTNILTNKGASSHDELFLFYAYDLFAPKWKPHRRNPVVSDVTRARPAGRLFTYNRKIYRPSQDCSLGYGTAVVINEVTALDRRDYREVELCRVTPEWDRRIKGLHTICHEGNLTIFDGKTFKRKWSGLSRTDRPLPPGRTQADDKRAPLPPPRVPAAV